MQNPDPPELRLRIVIAEDERVPRRAARGTAPAVVFVTAHGQHAARAFDIDAVDYVLKPATPERLATAVSRIRRRVAHTRLGERLRHRVRSLGDERSGHARRLLVRQTGHAYFVPVEEIHWAATFSRVASTDSVSFGLRRVLQSGQLSKTN